MRHQGPFAYVSISRASALAHRPSLHPITQASSMLRLQAPSAHGHPHGSRQTSFTTNVIERRHHNRQDPELGKHSPDWKREHQGAWMRRRTRRATRGCRSCRVSRRIGGACLLAAVLLMHAAERAFATAHLAYLIFHLYAVLVVFGLFIRWFEI